MDKSRFKKHDWIITTIVSLLLFIGVLTIYSTTINATSEASGAGSLPKQLIFVIVGMVIYFILSFIDISWFETRTSISLLYGGIAILLILVLFIGDDIAGTNRWIDIGFFSLQPSEYAKIIIIMSASFIFSYKSEIIAQTISLSSKVKQKAKSNNLLTKLVTNTLLLKYIIVSLASIPVIVLIFIQPALGNAIVIGTIWIVLSIAAYPKPLLTLRFISSFLLTMFLLANLFSFVIDKSDIIISFEPSNQIVIVAVIAIFSVIAIALSDRSKTLFTIVIPLVLALVLFFGFILSWKEVLKDYQKERIMTYINGPESDPTGSGYQVIQSKIALGSGRLWGKGFLQGTQSSTNILTQASTDFIFSGIGEQLGFVGSSFVLALFLILILRIYYIGSKLNNQFSVLICIGVGTMLLLHVFINVAATEGKIPVTGIPLPLVSYGGSAVVATLISLGVIQSIATSRKLTEISDRVF